MSIQSTNFKMNEMFFIIEIMYIMLENIIAQKQSQLYNIICSKYVYPLLQSIELHFINILYNRKFVNLLRDIINLLSQNPFDENNLSFFFIYKLCLKFVVKNYFDFLKPAILFGFTILPHNTSESNYDDNILKILIE